MHNQSKTALVIFGAFLATVLYDLFVVVMYGTPSSVSQFITDATGISTLQAIGVGALADHFCGFTMKRRIVNCPCCKSVIDVNAGKIVQ